MSNYTETSILKKWKLILGVLFAIVSPTITGTAAYYNLKLQLIENKQINDNKISRLELDTVRNFADKPTMDDMRKDLNNMRNDISEIKTLLKRKL